eukprot:Hpha_TRINITY_DN12338_c0_g1::TRINITY_DN12338_c0_g1_i1::g.155975::m.155975/K08857/NEK1_4_5; NIMA (never in mitosis gene a)-related kinase 1/4/5
MPSLESSRQNREEAARAGFKKLLGTAEEDARFEKIRRLEDGAFGDSFLVQDRSRPDAASEKPQMFVANLLSIPAMTHRDLRSTMSEVRCMSLLKHCNIVEYIMDLLQTGDVLFILMERCDCGDLEKQVRTRAKDMDYFKEKEAFLMTLQLCLALDHVHSKRMLHRNLKTANVYLDSTGLVKLGGFGHAHTYTETVSNVVAGTFVGTPVYLAPELWERKRYSKKADIWALGVIMYELLALKRPFSSGTVRDLMDKVLNGVRAPPPPHYSDDVIELCDLILTRSPQERPTTRQVCRNAYAKKGLKELLALTSRNRSLRQEVKDCIRDHIATIAAEESPTSEEEGRHGRYEGHVQRARHTETGLVWESRYLVLHSGRLEIFESKETDQEPQVIDLMSVANACPIGHQEISDDAGSAFVWALIMPDGSAIWFRNESQGEQHGWLDMLAATAENS